MKPFTVIFNQKMPFGGVAAVHCSWVFSETTESAAEYVMAGLGNYGSLIVIFEGHITPLLKGKHRVFIWDDSIKYQTKELPITVWERFRDRDK